MSQWTYDRPTKPGYYWAVLYTLPEVAYVDQSAGKLVVSVFDEDPRAMSECNGWRWWPVALVAPDVPEDDYVGP